MNKIHRLTGEPEAVTGCQGTVRNHADVNDRRQTDKNRNMETHCGNPG
jgi:hypothetical protein